MNQSTPVSAAIISGPGNSPIIATSANRNLQILALTLTVIVGVAMTIHIFNETRLFRLQMKKLKLEINDAEKLSN